ncbi:MAG TPA: alanine--tRNA ligase, partial [Actinomycetota bacterium]|nr:alanine--tRNA ligase [Actinomycetota bacterium]
MDTPSIRRVFLDFFAQRGHTVVPSSSLVPDDPTLLLTNAGMVQFKPYFLGEKPPPHLRAASVQKCFREIDLEEVGKTARHLTFFEMLGNFSFGDYFKLDACRWAWELLTTGYNLDPDRIWITVHESDDEAAAIWEQEVRVPPERILKRTREQGNFWDMGVAGPCGPCSELLYDRGEDFGAKYRGGELDEERYLEVWNLVFMQHMQDDRGVIVGDLPKKNVDTGMGLERLAAILQDVPSAFEIDSMAPMLRRAEELTGHRYGASHSGDVGLRVLAEHSRSMAMLIADGVLPGNTGRGYVLRRLIRRAARHARLLGVEDLVLSRVTEVVVDTFQEVYPEVGRNRDLIQKVVEKEETRFEQTLRQGLGILEGEITQLRKAGERKIPGDLVFKLHDTYGFPFDLTSDIAREEDLEVDRQEFDALMSEQRQRARAARAVEAEEGPQVDVLQRVLESRGKTDFLGYERLALDTTVVALTQGLVGAQVLEPESVGEVVLAETPFYPRGGGQIGDRGEIRTDSGTFRVEDTRWGIPGVVIHSGTVIAGEIEVGQEARAIVSPAHREGVRQSHTATHMLHWALRSLLGEHARQKGSLVEPGRLRFDFNHFEPVYPDRLAEIEEEINRRVLFDDSVHAFETTFDFATSIGALALFGEKYGDHVRVVEVGDYSKELCGGTHVAHTGQIGVIKLTHEGSVAAGIRRVEALTGLAGLNHLNAQAERLRKVAERLKTDPEHVLERLDRTLETLGSLQAQLSQRAAQGHREEVKAILASDAVKSLDGGYRVVVSRRDNESVDQLRKLAIALRDELGSGVVVVGSATDGKANLVAATSRDLVEKGVTSQGFLADGAAILGGGGG